MRWKDYESEHNEWYRENLLDQSMKMIINFEQHWENVETVHNLQNQLQCTSVSFSQSDWTSAVTSALSMSIIRSTLTTVSTTSAEIISAVPAVLTLTMSAALISTTSAALISTMSVSTEVPVSHLQLDCWQQEKKIWEQSADCWSESWDYILRCWKF